MASEKKAKQFDLDEMLSTSVQGARKRLAEKSRHDHDSGVDLSSENGTTDVPRSSEDNNKDDDDNDDDVIGPLPDTISEQPSVSKEGSPKENDDGDEDAEESDEDIEEVVFSEFMLGKHVPNKRVFTYLAY